MYHSLVDEVVVIDSHSTDDTASVAAEAGATTYRQQDIRPDLGDKPGKGEALWKGLLATTSDIVVYCDADLLHFDPRVIAGLLHPLLEDSETHFVKACYDRALNTGSTIHPTGGGRVTELVARPLFARYFPDLSGFIQPLAGEFAGTRTALSAIPYASHYAVDSVMLVDLLGTIGLDAMAQVDCGTRHHRHATDAALGSMSLMIHHALMARAHDEPIGPHTLSLLQFERGDGQFAPNELAIDMWERPPAGTV